MGVAMVVFSGVRCCANATARNLVGNRSIIEPRESTSSRSALPLQPHLQRANDFINGVATPRGYRSPDGPEGHAMESGFRVARSPVNSQTSTRVKPRCERRERRTLWILICFAINVSIYISHSDGAFLRSAAQMPLVPGLAGRLL